MRYGDPRDRFAAAEAIVERVEGRVPQQIELEDEGGSLLASVFWRYVGAPHLAKGLDLAEAVRQAEADPDAVQQWGREVGLLPAGPEPAHPPEPPPAA